MTELRWSTWGLVLGLMLGTSACSKGAAENKCKVDTDCKNGTLCEGGMCIPDEVAEKARGFDKKAAPEKPEATPQKEAEKKAEEAPPSEEKVPLIPLEKSDPPKAEDWEKAAEVNTQHEHGIAKECSMKVVREWVRVFCRGEILGYQDLTEFGKKSVDHYVSVKESSVSFVGRIKQGPRQFVRICRKADRAALAIYWPPGKDRPEHIALGDGKPCEVTEYLESPVKKDEGEALPGAPAEPAPEGKPVRRQKSEGQMTPKGVILTQ